MPMTMIPAMTAMTMKKTHTRINTNTNILILADITISNYQLPAMPMTGIVAEPDTDPGG